jgi:L-ascorbate metabolism protein UlaG (beta-lactamase superfamily)
MKTSGAFLAGLCLLGTAGLPVHLPAQTIQFTRVQQLTNREIALTITAPTGRAYRIESATNIIDWTAFVTFPTNGVASLLHTDSAAPYLESRFYRAVQLSGSNIVAGDHLSTTNGDVVIQPRYHATFLMQWNGLTIYSDPDTTTSYVGLPRADLILVTHEHSDHFDATAINTVKKTNTLIITTQAVYNQAAMMPHRSQTIVLTNGATTNVLGMEVEAIPAYNFPTGTVYHAKGTCNSYVLTVGGKRIFISGDTQDVPEMRALTNIDVAFVCMNLPFTMTVDAAANAVREFQPRIVYPYHFSSSDVNRFKQLVGTDLGIEVRLRKWY